MKMKSMKYIQKLFGLAALILTMFACAPQIDDTVDIGQAPTENQLDFTITPGTTTFKFVLSNTSKVTGITSWDLGNGSKSTEASPTVTYPLPGEYTVTMTLITRGGTATKSKKVVQTKTDYSIFTDPNYVLLSGGSNVAAGKTWVLDVASKGHIGVGPSEGNGNGMEWWAAGPNEKSGTGAYDDEINFKLNEFVATYINNGVSYVKGYRKDDAQLAQVYLNPRQNKDDWDVDFTPAPGKWTIDKRDGKVFLKLIGNTPLFPCFDVGAKDNEYEIVSVSENLLELTCFSSYEAWTKWHYYLVPKGYVKPKVTFEVAATPTGKVNEYSVKLNNVVIPSGLAISNIKVNFGDGTVKETSDMNATLTNTYMRKSPYNLTVTVTTSNETLTTSKLIEVAANHPDYVPFLLDMMVTYNDFSEVIMAPVLGQDCGVSVVDNPSKVYPDKSSKVAYYSKTNNQWANAYMQLAPGYRFDLRSQHIFRILVYGKAGQKILMKLENTDRGGNAWQTGTADLIYTIKKDNTWEIAEYNFAGVSAGWDWTGDQFTSDVTTSSKFNADFYNVVRIMCNPGDGAGTHQFYFDELSGPHVEGLKSAFINK